MIDVTSSLITSMIGMGLLVVFLFEIDESKLPILKTLDDSKLIFSSIKCSKLRNVIFIL